jgi:hypothetical protein
MKNEESIAAAVPTGRKRGRGGKSKALACGLGAGVVQAGLLNPFDRALYLSVKERRPFLHRENFTRPYQGFLQSVGGRAVSGGLFFPLESIFQSIYDQSSGGNLRSGRQKDGGQRALTNFLVGSAAGSVNAIILNPLSAIKYRMWGKEEKERGMIQEAKHMWQRGGVSPFFHGVVPTIIRDVVFGGTYTLIRFQLKDSEYTGGEKAQWASNMGAAALATVISGPFNLARNIQFATGSTEARPSISSVVMNLFAKASEKETTVDRLKYLQNRLRVGWGTIRVAAGMALGQQVYDSLFSMAQ